MEPLRLGAFAQMVMQERTRQERRHLRDKALIAKIEDRVSTLDKETVAVSDVLRIVREVFEETK